MLNKLKPLIPALALLSASAFAAVGVAQQISPVSSYWNFWKDVQTSRGCRGMWLEAEQSPPTERGGDMVSYGRINTRQCWQGGEPSGLLGGWIGVQVEGWRNGGICGRTVWNNSTTQTAKFGWKYTPCAGLQNGVYHTRVKGHIWTGSQWVEGGPQLSPTFTL